MKRAKGLRVWVDHLSRAVDEVRVYPPRGIIIGRALGCDIVVPALAREARLFDYLDGQYRLHPIAGMTGRVSRSGLGGTYEPLPSRVTNLRDRACGEFHLGHWHVQFLHTPTPPSRREAQADSWVCAHCAASNERGGVICTGCGGGIERVIIGKWRRGMETVFRLQGTTRIGRILFGPRGGDRAYMVKTANGQCFRCPELSLGSDEPS